MQKDLFERTREFLKRNNIKPKHGLGQNFLVNEQILEKIILRADIQPENLIIEIGPGIGTLTQRLAEEAKQVVSVEIDIEMMDLLEQTMQSHPNVIVLHQDFLKTDIQELFEKYKAPESKGFQIIANLPYYITTPIIQKVINERKNLVNSVFMVQREVAERLAAPPGNKSYGSLTVAVQYYMDVKITDYVPKSAFFPEPKVDSAILKMSPKTEKPVLVLNEELFFKIVYGAFRQRRKTLLNNLKQCAFLSEIDSDVLENILNRINVDKMRRGETLSIYEFGCLANEIYEIAGEGKKV